MGWGLLTMDVGSRKWWIALCGALFHALHVSVVYIGPATLLLSVQSEFHVSVERAVVPLNAYKLSLVAFSPLVGAGTSLVGYRPVIRVAAVFAGIAALCYPFVTDVMQLVFLEIGFALTFTFCGVAILHDVAVSWFDQNVGMPTAIILNGWSISGMVTPALLTMDIEKHGWRSASWHLSLLYCAVGIPIALFILRRRSEPAHVFRPATASSKPLLPTDQIEEGSWRESLSQITDKTRALFMCGSFWSLLVVFTTLAFILGIVQEHLLIHLKTEQGMTLSAAGRVLSTIHLCGLIVKPIAGVIGDQTDHRTVMCFGSVGVCLAASLLLREAPPSSWFFLFAVCFGISYPSVFCSMYSTVPVLFGASNVAVVQGLLLCFFSAGSTFGSMVASVLKTRTGSYIGALYIMAAVAGINVGSAFTLCFLNKSPSGQYPYTSKSSLLTSRTAEKHIVSPIAGKVAGSMHRR